MFLESALKRTARRSETESEIGERRTLWFVAQSNWQNLPQPHNPATRIGDLRLAGDSWEKYIPITCGGLSPHVGTNTLKKPHAIDPTVVRVVELSGIVNGCTLRFRRGLSPEWDFFEVGSKNYQRTFSEDEAIIILGWACYGDTGTAFATCWEGVEGVIRGH